MLGLVYCWLIYDLRLLPDQINKQRKVNLEIIDSIPKEEEYLKRLGLSRLG